MSTQQVQPQETPTRVNIEDTALPFEIIEIPMTQSYIEETLAEFEAKYGMTSEVFYPLWLKGDIDTKDTSLWAMLYESLKEDELE